MKINSINIQRFRSFKETFIDFGTGLNVLVGPNNSGKSSILESIYMAFQFLESNKGISSWNSKKKKLKGVTLRDPLTAIPDTSYLAYNLKKSAHKNDRIELDVSTDETDFKTWALFSGHNMNVYTGKDIDDQGSTQYRNKVKKLLETPPTFVPLFSGVIAVEEIKTAEVTDYYARTGKASEILRNKYLQLQKSNPENILKVNKYIKTKFNLDFIGSNADDLGVHVKTHYIENNEHPKKGEDFDISALGSGFQQILHLLLYIFSEETNVILIDEPDAHLHRNMQKTLFELLYEISIKENKQIIIATHSFEFIKLSSQIQDVKLYLIDKNQSQQTPISDYCAFLRDLYSGGLISEFDLKYNSTKFLVCEDQKNGKMIVESLLYKYKPEWKLKGFPFIFIEGRGTANDQILSSLKMRAEEDNNTKGYILNDPDGLSEDYCTAIETKKSNDKIFWKYIPYFEIENILLKPSIIKLAIETKISSESPDFFSVDEEYIKQKLADILNREEIKSHLRKSIGKKIQKFYHILEVDYGNYQSIAEARALEINDMDFSDKLKYLPGKEVMGLFFNELQIEKGVNINFMDLLNVFPVVEIPDFLTEICDNLVN